MATIDRLIGSFFWKGVEINLARPAQALQFARTVRWQAAAAKLRGEWHRRGVKVPPILIFSITHQCNLRCTGCYARAFQGGVGGGGAPAPATGGDAGKTGEDRGATQMAPLAAAGTGAAGLASSGDSREEPEELSDVKLRGIVTEADALGVSFFVIAGGEPLMRPEILGIAQRFPRTLFLIFTNGLLLDEATAERMTRLRNVVPLLSLEGTAAETDARRGAGTYERLLEAMARLKQRRVFFGCSLTLTSRDFSTVLDDSFVGGLVAAGCRFFLYADYTPMDEATEEWTLTDAQRGQVTARMASLRKRHPALFVAVPWDERDGGGCLSAGRGFVHINASGGVEPCPFAPYSDVDITKVSLMEALQSPFLERLRSLPALSEYTGGGCALWKNRAQVERVLAETRRP